MYNWCPLSMEFIKLAIGFMLLLVSSFFDNTDGAIMSNVMAIPRVVKTPRYTNSFVLEK